MQKQFLDNTGLTELLNELGQYLKSKLNKLTVGDGVAIDNNDTIRTTGIPFGRCDSTSTATKFTATVPGIYKLEDGVCCMIDNGVITSASGFTLNVNGLGAKPVYTNLAAATRDTTIFNINYTMLFVYDETRVSGGCWVCYRGYDSNTNTIGYQLRTNSTVRNVSDTARYYKIYFTSADGTKWVPASVNSTNNATSARPVNQRPIDPFGRIVYTSANTNYAAGANLAATTIWDQYNLTLGYSFNRTGAALTLTAEASVYLKCAPLTDGSAIMDADTPIVLALPTTNDGKIYIFLGVATSATAIELVPHHPVYYHDGTGIRIWTGKDSYSKSEVDAALNGKQNNLTFDNTPTANSTNPVTSGGIKTELDNKQDKPIELLTFFYNDLFAPRFPTSEENARVLTEQEQELWNKILDGVANKTDFTFVGHPVYFADPLNMDTATQHLWQVFNESEGTVDTLTIHHSTTDDTELFWMNPLIPNDTYFVKNTQLKTALDAKQDKDLIVNITNNNNTLSADKTFTEIMTAYTAGKNIRIKYDSYDYIVQYKDGGTDFYFTCTEGDDYCVKILHVDDNNLWKYDRYDYLKGLTFDNAPTANSYNPVYSKGIKTALDAKQDNILVVTLTKSMGNINGDKTLTQINTAISNGIEVIVKYQGRIYHHTKSDTGTSPATPEFSCLDAFTNKIYGVYATSLGWFENTVEEQSKLVSRTNIKTVNNTSLLGSGNVDVTEFTELTAEEGLMLYSKMMGGTISDQTAFNAMCEKINTGLSVGKQIRGIITSNNLTSAVMSVNGVRYSATHFMLTIYATLWEYIRYRASFVKENDNWSATRTEYVSLDNHNIGENIRCEYDASFDGRIFSAVDEKVAQTASSENVDIPLLLASGTTPETAGAKYDADFKFNPSTNTLKVGTGTLTATNYSGNAATATSDSLGNNISETYATKSEVEDNELVIARSLTELHDTKQELLTFDTTPTSNSINPVTSDGIKKYVDNAIDASTPMTEITYSDLVTARNNNNLKPGTWYRITDYQCTTTQKNTQSAGHQFDIVLLALSENKLAEEGWAMEHPTDIYDVTFYDGFTKKCYLYVTDISEDDDKIYESWNLIDIDTMLGRQLDDVVRGESASIDDNNKQVSFRPGAVNPSTFALDTPNLTYNYFQNSNLSAWKVWYCLDDSKYWSIIGNAYNCDLVFGGDTMNNVVAQRIPSSDTEVGGVNYYYWNISTGAHLYLDSDALSNGNYNVYYPAGNLLGTGTVTINSVISGTGTIYRMIDEFNNDIPYDFKNIQFKRKLSNGGYDETNGTDTWCYTFNYWNSTDSICLDASIVGNTSIPYVYGNKMGTYNFNLNNNVFLGKDNYFICNSNIFGNNCCDNTFGDRFFSNTFGDTCYSNTFGNYCNNNIFGNNCNNNVFGNDCQFNAFGDGCYSNTSGFGCVRNIFGNHCYNNTFGHTCESNIFGNDCYSNTFKNNCDGNIFGNDCNINTFGGNCSDNIFGNYFTSNTFGDYSNFNAFGNICDSNIFGNDCECNTFGNSCNYNVFGNSCYYNTFGNDCWYNIFGTSSSAKINYVRHIQVENGVQYVNITTSATTSDSNYLQNITIAQGVSGTSSSIRKVITHPTVNDNFQTIYRSINSQVVTV